MHNNTHTHILIINVYVYLGINNAPVMIDVLVSANQNEETVKTDQSEAKKFSMLSWLIWLLTDVLSCVIQKDTFIVSENTFHKNAAI